MGAFLPRAQGRSQYVRKSPLGTHDTEHIREGARRPFSKNSLDSQKEATGGQKGAQRRALDTHKVEERRRSSPAPERRARKKRQEEEGAERAQRSKQECRKGEAEDGQREPRRGKRKRESKAIAKEGIGQVCRTRLRSGEAEYTTRRKWRYFGMQGRVHSEFTDLYL